MEVIALVLIAVLLLGMQSWFFTRFGPKKLDYSLTFSTNEAHEGDDIYLVETVHNRKLFPVPWLKVDIHSSRWLDFAGTSSVVTQDNRRVTSTFCLGSYQKVTRRWKLKCLKRGVFNTENVTLIWGDLLDMSKNSIPVKVNAALKVFPEVINLEEVFIPANYLQGDMLVKRWVVDDPFIVSGAREYGPGDPLNRIHWRATAKEGRLMVKKNDFTSQMSLTILFNIQTIEYEYNEVVDRSAAELGIKVAATVVDRALEIGAPVRFGTNGCQLNQTEETIFTGEASGREHAAEILEILSNMKLKSVKDFEYFLEDTYAHITACDVIIITAYLSNGICDYARLMMKQHNIVRVIVLNRFVNSIDIPGDIDIYILPGGLCSNEGELA